MADLPTSVTASTSAAPLFNISGLASGLDTNSIIGQLIAIERQPEVRALQQQHVEEARQKALRDVHTRLTNLQTAIAGLPTPTWGDARRSTRSDAANVGVVRTGGAAAGGYQVQVTQLARAHQVTQWRPATRRRGRRRRSRSRSARGTAVDVDVKAGDTLDTIAAKINAAIGHRRSTRRS